MKIHADGLIDMNEDTVNYIMAGDSVRAAGMASNVAIEG